MNEKLDERVFPRAGRTKKAPWRMPIDFCNLVIYDSVIYDYVVYDDLIFLRIRKKRRVVRRSFFSGKQKTEAFLQRLPFFDRADDRTRGVPVSSFFRRDGEA